MKYRLKKAKKAKKRLKKVKKKIEKREKRFSWRDLKIVVTYYAINLKVTTKNYNVLN